MNNKYLELESIADLLEQGYNINDILIIVENIFEKKQVLKIKELLYQGFALEEIILKLNYDDTFKEYFNFFCLKNDVSNAIKQSIIIQKKQNDFINRTIKTVRYPVFLILFLFFFSLFISFYLLPEIHNLLEQFNAQSSTFQNMAFSLFSIIPIVVLVFCVIICSASLYVFISIKKSNINQIEKCLQIPIFKNIIKRYFSFKFAMYYNELLTFGYNSTQMIDFMKKNLNNSTIKVVVFKIIQKTEIGDDFFDTMINLHYFENLFQKYLILLQKQTTVNKNLNSYLELSVKLSLDTVNRIIAISVPFIYTFIGGFVIFVYVSIILPLMNIIQL